MTQRTLFAIVFILSNAFFAYGQSVPSSTSVRYSHAALHQLQKTAHDRAQYQTLADYFRQQEKNYRTKEAFEKSLWDVRAHGIAANANKYPRPVDSAHYLYDAYSYQADRADKLATRYEQLAHSGSTLASR